MNLEDEEKRKIFEDLLRDPEAKKDYIKSRSKFINFLITDEHERQKKERKISLNKLGGLNETRR